MGMPRSITQIRRRGRIALDPGEESRNVVQSAVLPGSTSRPAQTVRSDHQAITTCGQSGRLSRL